MSEMCSGVGPRPVGGELARLPDVLRLDFDQPGNVLCKSLNINALLR